MVIEEWVWKGEAMTGGMMKLEKDKIEKISIRLFYN